jgi:L-alanine-DL-glutamate epimerase-like enolase superfamily enzyme
MRIVDCRERTVGIGAAMRNASINFGAMTASALALVTDRGITGYAFDSIGRYGKGALLRERFIPRLVRAQPASLLDADGLPDPAAFVHAVMTDEKAGGHGERPGAVGLIEAAAWDLRAKMQGVPLWNSISQYFRIASSEPMISVYASCGHFRTDDILRDEVKRAIDAGFTCVKIKVAGDLESDLKRLERAAAALPRHATWAVDVNGALEEENMRPWLDALAPFKLAWIEEPAAPLDYEFLKQCARTSAAPLATGENLFSLDDARNLLRYGGLRPARDFVQVDPLLAYGVGEYAKIIALYEAAGWKRTQFLPHAGHLFAAHCVAGLGLGMAEAAPDASLSYGGYWDGVQVGGGRVTIPDTPGVGYERKSNLHALLEFS